MVVNFIADFARIPLLSLLLLITDTFSPIADVKSSVPDQVPWKRPSRMVNGIAFSALQFPYVAAIVIQEKFVVDCGGSILSNYWVLTAGHCIRGRMSSRVIIVGSVASEFGHVIHNIKTAFVHPKYAMTRYEVINDIGLIKVMNPFNFDGACQSIRLPTFGQKFPSGSLAFANGWGAIFEKGPASDRLLTVQLPLVSNQHCRVFYMKINQYVADRTICAGYVQGGTGTCQGDSGGPLAFQGLLIGVVSFAEGCARPNFPTVFTEVSAFVPWILQYIN